MRTKATRAQIKALLRLAELDARTSDAAAADSSRQRLAADRRKIPAALLERYEALVGRGRSPAVVAATAGCCSGCHVRLPAVLDHEIRKAPGIFTCPHCHRLLYAPAHLNEPPNKPAAAVSS